MGILMNEKIDFTKLCKNGIEDLVVKIPTPKNYTLSFLPITGFSTTLVVEKNPVAFNKQIES
jgi:hypothetical protein